MYEWILALITETADPAATWKDTYPSTARAIEQVARERPLFSGVDGTQRTAALLVAVSWFESRHNPRAIGDKGQSLCAFQIGKSNLKALKITEEQILSDILTCTRAAVQMMKVSFGVCRENPIEEKLGHYASGGQTCAGLRESRNRMLKAQWLFRHRPPPAHVTSGD